jgi:hypothetical protein
MALPVIRGEIDREYSRPVRMLAFAIRIQHTTENPMKNSIRLLLASVLLTLALPMTGFAASSGSKKVEAPATFASLDQNGDGIVTAAEYSAAMKDQVTDRTAKMRFNALDKNKDGKITREEFAASEAEKKQPKKKKTQ